MSTRINRLLAAIAILFVSATAQAAQASQATLTGPGPTFLEKMRSAVKDLRPSQSASATTVILASPSRNPFESKAIVVKSYRGMLDTVTSFELNSHADGVHFVKFSHPQLSNLDAFFPLAKQLLSLTNPNPNLRATPTKPGLSVGTIGGYKLMTIDTPEVQYVFQPHWASSGTYTGLTLWTNEPGIETHFPN